MGTGRKWYEVRIREKLGPDRWVKKSKFFEAKGPGDAAEKYKGAGNIMWVSKIDKERLGGIGSFFKLGDEILGELRGNGSQDVKENNRRRYYERRRKEATN